MNEGAVRLGFLYPGFAAEDDYPRMAERLVRRPEVRLVHTSVGEDAHRVDALLDLGGPERLAAGAEQLAGAVDVVCWACTSGSFVFGWEGARAQADAIGERLGVPASSTSFAFVEAIRAVGARRVAIAATYPEAVVAAFARFLAVADIEVVASSSQGIVTADEVGRLSPERTIAFVTAADHPDADAVLVPDTALHSVAQLDEFERRLDKPVLTANQVTMWEALHLLEANRPQPGLGRLFTVAS